MSPILALIHQIGTLKQLKRSGWQLHGCPESESVADHSFRVASMALLLAPKAELNVEKCLALALVHDLAESVVGDITPHDGVSKEEQRARERAALTEMLPAEHPDLLLLWEEFEAGESLEAQFVYQLDKLEAVIQASEYMERYPEVDLSEFATTARAQITHPILRELFNELPPRFA